MGNGQNKQLPHHRDPCLYQRWKVDVVSFWPHQLRVRRLSSDLEQHSVQLLELTVLWGSAWKKPSKGSFTGTHQWGATARGLGAESGVSLWKWIAGDLQSIPGQSLSNMGLVCQRKRTAIRELGLQMTVDQTWRHESGSGQHRLDYLEQSKWCWNLWNTWWDAWCPQASAQFSQFNHKDKKKNILLSNSW